MTKGILIGVLFSSLLLISCYHLLGYDAASCGPGIGFVLSPLVLFTTVIISALFLAHKSKIITVIAKTTLLIVSLALLIFFAIFFIFPILTSAIFISFLKN